MDSIKKSINQWVSIIRIPVFIFFMFMLIAIISGCSKDDMSTNSGGNTTGTNDIVINGMSFSSAGKTVTVGTTLKWTNQDAATHTVTSGTPGSPSGLFDSGNLAQNGTFSYTFNQEGTFNYYCKIHSSMTGTITVQAVSPGGGGY